MASHSIGMKPYSLPMCGLSLSQDSSLIPNTLLLLLILSQLHWSSCYFFKVPTCLHLAGLALFAPPQDGLAPSSHHFVSQQCYLLSQPPSQVLNSPPPVLTQLYFSSYSHFHLNIISIDLLILCLLHWLKSTKAMTFAFCVPCINITKA